MPPLADYLRKLFELTLTWKGERPSLRTKKWANFMILCPLNFDLIIYIDIHIKDLFPNRSETEILRVSNHDLKLKMECGRSIIIMPRLISTLKTIWIRSIISKEID